MNFISNNIETIISVLTMVITWVLGFIAKRSPYINNNLIIIQNITMGLIAAVLYYKITKDFSIAISISGIFAETGYNLIHNIQKLISEISKNKDIKTEEKAK